MKNSLLTFAITILHFTSLSHAASTTTPQSPNCVSYVIQRTGWSVPGNAGDWWANAGTNRGSIPKVGSVLVFAATGNVPSGHVAYVTEVLSRDTIRVDHANWPSGTLERKGDYVWDQSGSWSNIKIQTGTLNQGKPIPGGTLYQTLGFVYGPPTSNNGGTTTTNSGYDSKFVSDVTFPDGTKLLSGGMVQMKAWRLQNTGGSEWKSSKVSLVPLDATARGILIAGGPIGTVKAGSTGEVDAWIMLPKRATNYRAWFQLSADGKSFGAKFYLDVITY